MKTFQSKAKKATERTDVSQSVCLLTCLPACLPVRLISLMHNRRIHLKARKAVKPSLYLLLALALHICMDSYTVALVALLLTTYKLVLARKERTVDVSNHKTYRKRVLGLHTSIYIMLLRCTVRVALFRWLNELGENLFHPLSSSLHCYNSR